MDGLVEQLEGFGETPLDGTQRGPQIQQDGLVPESIPDAGGAGLPPSIGHLEEPLAAGEIALHAVGIGKSGPGEGSELKEPLLLIRLSFGDQIRDMDSQLGEMDGVGGVRTRCLAALADEELAEPPAHETGLGVEGGEASLRNEGDELSQELGRLGAGSGENGVDESEDRREGMGLVQLEEPAAGLTTDRTGRQGMKEMLVLLDGAVDGEQTFQGGGIEMLVLHAFLSF
jgi:hypothetical protein